MFTLGTVGKTALSYAYYPRNRESQALFRSCRSSLNTPAAETIFYRISCLRIFTSLFKLFSHYKCLIKLVRSLGSHLLAIVSALSRSWYNTEQGWNRNTPTNVSYGKAMNDKVSPSRMLCEAQGQAVRKGTHLQKRQYSGASPGNTSLYGHAYVFQHVLGSASPANLRR